MHIKIYFSLGAHMNSAGRSDGIFPMVLLPCPKDLQKSLLWGNLFSLQIEASWGL